VHLVYSGLLSGLVAVTGGAAGFSAPHAALVGAAAGIFVPWLEMRLDLVWKIDDPSGLISVCAGGGLIGTIASALLTSDPLGDRLRAAGVQILGLTAVAGMTLLIAGTVLTFLRLAVGVRVSEADEFDGLDLAEHDLNAYPDFQQTTIKSYHLREM
jgi:ammonium transporter, Amt family